MPATEETLTVALQQLERLLRDQLDSVGALSAKASVLLGFALTAAGAVVGLDRQSIASNPGAASVSTAFLLVASAVFADCYRMAIYRNPPDENGLLRLLDSTSMTLRRKLVAAFASAITENRQSITRRFHRMNLGLAWFFAGIVIYALGVALW